MANSTPDYVASVILCFVVCLGIATTTTSSFVSDSYHPPPFTKSRFMTSSPPSVISPFAFFSGNGVKYRLTACNSMHDDNDNSKINEESPSSPMNNRREFLSKSGQITAFTLSCLELSIPNQDANAAVVPFLPPWSLSKDKKPIDPKKIPEQTFQPRTKLSSVEDCLLDLLPVRNPIFRKLQTLVENLGDGISSNNGGGVGALNATAKSAEEALSYLDDYRGKLEPSFNINDEDTMKQILKSEKFEKLMEELRNNLVMLKYINTMDMDAPAIQMIAPLNKRSIIVLSQIGELLVNKFPYELPTDEKLSSLPRLLGRARVTFTFVRRKNKVGRRSVGDIGMFSDRKGNTTPLGNVTIIADGYAAPITAGNFVDLSIRNFYTGLPVKNMKKRWAARAPIIDENIPPTTRFFESAALELNEMIRANEDEDDTVAISTITPMLGSFQEGFIDPLTAKPRKIPLEIVNIDRTLAGIGVAPSFQYSLEPTSTSTMGEMVRGDSSDNNSNSNGGGIFKNKFVKPLLTFDIPGLVALNHPDKNPNGGSSEFFSLPCVDIDSSPGRIKALNGQYAPFGYVIEGLDILQNLEPTDEISATFVDEYGASNLMKIRQATFGNVLQSSSSSSGSNVDAK